MVPAAYSASRCTGLVSPDTPANKTISASVTVFENVAFVLEVLGVPAAQWLIAKDPMMLGGDTAPVEVLYASVAGLRLTEAQRAVVQRNSQHWRTLEEAGQALGDAGKSLTSSAHQLASNYVEVVGRVRLGSTTLTERSVIQRDDNQRVLWRERGVFAAQAASLQ